MGYTHYWESTGFNDAQWNKLTAGARAVIEAASKRGILLAFEFDQPAEPPVIDDGVIRFNGVGKKGHETFALFKRSTSFDCCKTAQKPYDAAAVAILILASECGPLKWSSDGVEEDWAGGRELLAASRGSAEPTVFINDIEVTALQAEAVRSVYRRPIDGEKLSFEKFTEGLTPMVFGDGAVVLPWCNMFLAIETDGHVHS